MLSPPAAISNRPRSQQAPGIGLIRVILNEYSNLRWRAIDLPPEPSATDATSLVERAVSQGRGTRNRACAAKLVMCGDSIAAGRGASNGSIPLCRCVSNLANAVTSIRFALLRSNCRSVQPGQVLIEVKAAGMNFRDVLKALALYPGDAPDARIFGDEVAGIVRAVGPDVTHVVPGDRVFGLAVFGLATHAIARGGRRATDPGRI